MERIKSWGKIIIGCLIIGVVINVFFKDIGYVPNGTLGFSVLQSIQTNTELALSILLVNIGFLLLGLILLPKKKLANSILPLITIPFFVYITKDMGNSLNIKEADSFLLSIYGGVTMGVGLRFIYKEKIYATASDIIKSISNEIAGIKGDIVPYALDILWIAFSFMIFGAEKTLNTAVAIIITEFISHRANIGTSDAKVFYIITKKEEKIKEYITKELGCGFTELDVKGGFSKNKNKVIMTVIPTKDYYKMKEIITDIDNKAFITITDSYEIINGKIKNI